MTDRTDYTAGLRALADLIDTQPELALPYDGQRTGTSISVFVDSKEELAAWARALPGTKTKSVDNEMASYGFQLNGSIAGLHLVIFANRNEVCTARVTGTKEVTSRRATGYEEVTKTVDVIEWDCAPVLTDARGAVVCQNTVNA